MRHTSKQTYKIHTHNASVCRTVFVQKHSTYSIIIDLYLTKLPVQMLSENVNAVICCLKIYICNSDVITKLCLCEKEAERKRARLRWIERAREFHSKRKRKRIKKWVGEGATKMFKNWRDTMGRMRPSTRKYFYIILLTYIICIYVKCCHTDTYDWEIRTHTHACMHIDFPVHLTEKLQLSQPKRKKEKQSVHFVFSTCRPALPLSSLTWVRHIIKAFLSSFCIRAFAAAVVCPLFAAPTFLQQQP